MQTTAGTWVVRGHEAQCMGTRVVLTEDSPSIAAGGQAAEGRGYRLQPVGGRAPR